MKIQIFLLVLCSAVFVKGNNLIKNCPNEISKPKQTVTLENCGKSFCIFKKRTIAVLKVKFIPDRNITKLTHDVTAKIFNVKVPFVGIDRDDACKNIYEADDENTKVNCPLVAGKEYLYIFKTKILDIYPEVKPLVHWGALSDDGQSIFCFEVPIKIIK